MEQHEWLAERFEENRSHLRTVAFRMLGSLIEADDAVQEAWLRLTRADRSDVENLRGWLTTVTARVCLNMRARSFRREQPIDASLDELALRPDIEIDPEKEALLSDSVGLVLEQVAEREPASFNNLAALNAQWR